MSVEKGPEFRIVGGASPEKKEEVKKELQKALFNHFESLSPEERKKVAKFEYKKSDEEKGLIDFANQETNRLRQEAGLEPYSIPYENYHLLPSKKYEEVKLGGSDAMTSYTSQGILLNKENLSSDPTKLGSAFVHETLHLKGHFTGKAKEYGKNIRRTIFREGVSVYGTRRDELHEHFDGLHEAIVANQEKKSFPKLLDIPFFQKEKEWLVSDEAKKIRKEMAEKMKISEDEFRWVDKKGGWGTFPFRAQREVLDFVCAEIQKEHSQQYQDKEDVFREFLKSHFTGQLLTIARLVEKTFGEGNFRVLGNMSAKKESAILHMELLRKARVRQLKKEKI